MPDNIKHTDIDEFISRVMALLTKYGKIEALAFGEPFKIKEGHSQYKLYLRDTTKRFTNLYDAASHVYHATVNFRAKRGHYLSAA